MKFDCTHEARPDSTARSMSFASAPSMNLCASATVGAAGFASAGGGGDGAGADVVADVGAAAVCACGAVEAHPIARMADARKKAVPIPLLMMSPRIDLGTARSRQAAASSTMRGGAPVQPTALELVERRGDAAEPLGELLARGRIGQAEV